MINRRNFLQRSGALALSGLALGNTVRAFSLSPKGAHAAGVQLYTVMSKIDADLDGTLKKIAAIGYREVESAFSMKGGYYGFTPKQFAAKAKEFGLSWKSHHSIGAAYKPKPGAPPLVGADGKPFVIPPMKNLRENYQSVVDDVAEGGVGYLVCSSTPLDTMEDIKLSMETLNKTGEACKKAGIVFAYHNHTREFETIEGQVPYDMFLTQISADIMKMELDLGWATKAGADPVALFKKNPGRYPLWHVKDLDKDQKPVEVGNGHVDFKTIFDNASVAGMKHFFVEQDGAPDPLVNIETSFKNLSKYES